MKVAVAFGANLGDREATFEKALVAIEGTIGSVCARSSLYETEPLLHPDSPQIEQASYLNAVILVETEMDLPVLLQNLHAIETSLGRERSQEQLRWGPRTIDLDLIVAEDKVFSSADLVVPHPEMHKRRFVLEPLAEVWPQWVHPVLDLSVEELLLRTST